MNHTSLLSNSLDELKARILKYHVDVQDSTAKHELEIMLNGGDISKVKIFETGQDDDGLFDLSEDNYLLASAWFYWASKAALGRNDFQTCLKMFGQAHSRLGGRESLLILRRYNSRKRHRESYQLQKQAIEYWRTHIGSSIPNEAAARTLAKQFPISHRVLARYVAEAKKQDANRASLFEEIRFEYFALKDLPQETK